MSEYQSVLTAQAKEIEALRAEVEKLRGALKEIEKLSTLKPNHPEWADDMDSINNIAIDALGGRR